jgi:hypothetical protein
MLPEYWFPDEFFNFGYGDFKNNLTLNSYIKYETLNSLLPDKHDASYFTEYFNGDLLERDLGQAESGLVFYYKYYLHNHEGKPISSKSVIGPSQEIYHRVTYLDSQRDSFPMFLDQFTISFYGNLVESFFNYSDYGQSASVSQNNIKDLLNNKSQPISFSVLRDIFNLENGVYDLFYQPISCRDFSLMNLLASNSDIQQLDNVFLSDSLFKNLTFFKFLYMNSTESVITLFDKLKDYETYNLIYDWHFNFISRSINQFLENSQLPYIYYFDNQNNIARKEVILILNKFTSYQDIYARTNLFFQFYYFFVNFFHTNINKILSLLEVYYQSDSIDKALSLSVSKRSLKDFFSFLISKDLTLDFSESGFYYIFDDQVYPNAREFHRILDISYIHSRDLILSSDILVNADSNSIIPYSNKFLPDHLNSYYLHLFSHKRICFNHMLFSNVFSFHTDFNKSSDFYNLYFMPSLIYENILLVQKLKNNFGFYMDLNEFTVEDLDILKDYALFLNYWDDCLTKNTYFRWTIYDDHMANIFYNLGVYNDIADISKDFWIGDSLTWYLLSYDIKFFDFANISKNFNKVVLL